jgi:hypothetical protein
MLMLLGPEVFVVFCFLSTLAIGADSLAQHMPRLRLVLDDDDDDDGA